MNSVTPPIALTIAGSDPSGGAGLQADLKTFHAHRVYGASVVSLITVQNTVGVTRVDVLDPTLVAEQLAAVRGDLDVGAAKTGALGSAGVVDVVVTSIRARPLRLVVDPVMISKHGAALLDTDAERALRERLIPLAYLVTPNAPEAARLSGIEVNDVASAREAALRIGKCGVRNVLVKGGHLAGDTCVDVLFAEGEMHELTSPRVVTTAGHGTGCTLSAAITARLARGESLLDATTKAKAWLASALASAPRVGHGIGPVDHDAPVPD